MLIVETIARIRREHFIKGKTIKEIARDLKVSRNTVRKVLRSGETSFEYERAVQPRPKLGRWAADLDGLLASNAAKSAREKLTPIRGQTSAPIDNQGQVQRTPVKAEVRDDDVSLMLPDKHGRELAGVLVVDAV